MKPHYDRRYRTYCKLTDALRPIWAEMQAVDQ
jgi:L-xylulokinase